MPQAAARFRSEVGPEGLLWVNSDKTHLEHNESALTPIADMGADIDFCR